MICANRGPDGERTKPAKLALAGQIRSTPWMNFLNPHVVSPEATAAFKARWGDSYQQASWDSMNQAELFVGEVSGASDGRGAEFYYGRYAREALMFMFRQQGDGDYPSLYKYAADSSPLVHLAHYQDLEDLRAKYQESIVDLAARRERRWQQEHKRRFPEYGNKGTY
ncbi:hypothetical protein A2631_05750 [Candidatus Daviesbacteria bacterium RIFCSPHIGHO2_01_FULL_44_29]|uniref:Uncharacterized protein n=1 Tax=Candidatus Daviesbacteria bacterium RIFCSPHIGHO2_02_FULL_43_12 TaxID=1797776 RepID=A0A1F5KII1_9BACT|nr:MAG: hypothetical protein A2631_05750 [Candidatus Daviesbacteria bacterium RIFCSPHIGHO2_01_FULL_44_29]OGE39484.1 MAG: hypothetical protein A3E86_04010 [Candidatus Daviesbacteria bacterium RIFCSPHIGHO2_12_FULL_47_45]OGE40644.1 MAG: hypothetical protein A3D25_05800 [Candidatus Daviesbacteria bacterium RIFCSPHIGHO2_02_FULL_43_12]OGE69860.1 MAG: hypothetical protein A3B55_05625 [Candidatus Daviesbacteria bacterium RIFCSPLOWO2_01_FULL_43_15]